MASKRHSLDNNILGVLLVESNSNRPACPAIANFFFSHERFIPANSMQCNNGHTYMLPPFVESMNARLFLLGRRRFLFIRKSPLEKRFLRGQIHSSQFLMLGSFGLVQRTNASRHSRHLFVLGRLSRLLDLSLSFRMSSATLRANVLKPKREQARNEPWDADLGT